MAPGIPLLPLRGEAASRDIHGSPPGAAHLARLTGSPACMTENSLPTAESGASPYPVVDLALARRLERAEADANAAFVDARRAVDPDSGAEWIEVAGAYAMFDHIGSPCTQTFGLGLFAPFLEPEFDRVEAFFRERGSDVFHEVCTLTAAESAGLLAARGYSPIEPSTVLVRPTDLPLAGAPDAIRVRRIDESESAAWAGVSAEGWSSEGTELAAFVEDLGLVTSRARCVHCFLAELDQVPIAAGALSVGGGVALMAGASTVPAGRRQGAQGALLAARLAFAAALGIDLAMVVTQPGSASQRNAERQGFRPVYGRSKWQLATSTSRT
jgi:hypothetical protein